MNEAFVKIAELWDVRGLPPMNTVEGLCVILVDDHWTIKMNGHRDAVESVPPFSALLEFNGWPAGIIDPYGGTIASGELANEDTFITAMGAAIERERGKE